MDQDSTTEETKQQVPTQSIPEFYTNTVKFLINPYDVQLTLGVMSELGKPSKEIAIIRMSPQHALVLSKLLGKNLQIYQEKVGKIVIPQQLLDQLGIAEDNPDAANDES